MKNISILIVIASLLPSCFSIKPGVTKTGKNLWEEFYVSQGVSQYFIKPLLFKNEAGHFLVDFTFRNTSDSVTVNFTIKGVNLPSQRETIFFCSSVDTIHIGKAQTIFRSAGKNGIDSRESSKIEFSEFIRLIKCDHWNIKTSDVIFQPISKTEKYLYKLRNNLISIL
jgi:hypothetical protein